MDRPPELHVAGVVVHAAPSRLPAIGAAVGVMPGAEVHASAPQGRLVVTLEAASAAAMTQTIADIQRLDGVLSAALVWQCADTLDNMNEDMRDVEA